MTDVLRGQDHKGNAITNADLRQIAPEWLHPDVLTVYEVLAGAGVEVVANPDGTLTIASTGSIQGGPGIQVDTAGDVTVVAADTGEGIVVTVNGLAINVDNVTTRINANDQLEVIAASEVEIADTDPMAANPDAELWYQPGQTPPPVPPALWDIAATYQIGDYALWPDPNHWQATAVTTGQEPGTTTTVTDGYQFPGTSGSLEGLNSGKPGASWASGFRIEVRTNGALGNGKMLGILDGASIPVINFGVAGPDMEFGLRGASNNMGYHQWRVPTALFNVATRPWIAASADPGANVITWFDSADGVTWNQVTTTDTSGDAMTLWGASTNFAIGNDKQAVDSNYTGVLGVVRTKALDGTLWTSWDSMTMPSADGTGTSPETGESYAQAGPTALVPGASVPIATPWVAVPPPPTVATPGVLRANVNGVWEDVTAAGLTVSTDVDNEVMLGTDGGLYSNEVHLGATAPTLSGPDLWANPDEGTLYAAATGPTGAVEWVPVGGSEVEVDAVEPAGEWELWADTSTVGPIVSTTVIALDDLSDVDTVTTAPTDKAALTFDSASGQWIPSTGSFLPLTGGTVSGIVNVDAPSGKINLRYPNSQTSLELITFDVQRGAKPSIRVTTGYTGSGVDQHIEFWSAWGYASGTKKAWTINAQGDTWCTSSVSATAFNVRTLLAADLSGVPGVKRASEVDDQISPDGESEGIDIGSVVTGLASLARDQKAQIDALTARLVALEAFAEEIKAL